jgi:hypothetical protein
MNLEMSKEVLEIKIYQTDIGYTMSIDEEVPLLPSGYDISFTSLNEILCFLFYEFSKDNIFTIVACEGDDSMEQIIEFEMDAKLNAKINNQEFTNNVLVFKPKEDK